MVINTYTDYLPMAELWVSTLKMSSEWQISMCSIIDAHKGNDQ